MAIFDKENMFCFNTSLDKVATAAAILGDVIDLWGGDSSATIVPPTGGPLTNLRDYTAGPQPMVFAQITAPITQATGSVQFDLITSTEVALTGGTTVTIWSSGALAEAITGTTAGYRLRVPKAFSIPLGRLRYLGWFYTVTTTTVSGSAKFTSGLTWNDQSSPNSYR